jgi:hypothetical protein
VAASKFCSGGNIGGMDATTEHAEQFSGGLCWVSLAEHHPVSFTFPKRDMYSVSDVDNHPVRN